MNNDSCAGFGKAMDMVGPYFNTNANMSPYQLFKIPNRLTKFTTFQYKWLASLSQRERYLLVLYTYTGDRVINQILRGNQQDTKQRNCPFEKNIPLFEKYYQVIKNYRGGQGIALPVDYRSISPKQSFLKLEKTNMGDLRAFANELLALAYRTPELKEPIQVFRGVKREEDIYTHGNEFLSTTFNEQTARGFQGGAPCCFLYITINPGVRVIWMDPISNFQPPNSESEILVCPPFNVTKRKFGNDSYVLTINPRSTYSRPVPMEIDNTITSLSSSSTPKNSYDMEIDNSNVTSLSSSSTPKNSYDMEIDNTITSLSSSSTSPPTTPSEYEPALILLQQGKRYIQGNVKFDRNFYNNTKYQLYEVNDNKNVRQGFFFIYNPNQKLLQYNYDVLETKNMVKNGVYLQNTEDVSVQQAHLKTSNSEGETKVSLIGYSSTFNSKVYFVLDNDDEETIIGLFYNTNSPSVGTKPNDILTIGNQTLKGIYKPMVKAEGGKRNKTRKSKKTTKKTRRK